MHTQNPNAMIPPYGIGKKKEKKKLKKNLLTQAYTAKYHIEHILHNFAVTSRLLAIDVVKLHPGHTVPNKSYFFTDSVAQKAYH